jgi:predicted metalloendopeptidase
LDTWILGYLDTWILGYLDTWILGYLDTWILGYLDTWKVYLSYHMISNNARLLPEEIEAANFDFWDNTLQGRKKRLNRCGCGVSE